MQVRCVLGGAALLAVVAAHAHDPHDARGDMLRRAKPLSSAAHVPEIHAPPADANTHAMYRAAKPAHAAHPPANTAFAALRDAPHIPQGPPRKHLASGAVIGISIALGLGVAFLVGCVTVLGAVWTRTHTLPAPLTAAAKRAQ